MENAVLNVKEEGEEIIMCPENVILFMTTNIVECRRRMFLKFHQKCCCHCHSHRHPSPATPPSAQHPIASPILPIHISSLLY